jgi:hypothetical protein
MENKDIKIYPNPVQNEVTIELQNLESSIINELQIYTVDGRLQYSQNIVSPQTKIDVTKFTNGLYYIILRKEGVVKYSNLFLKL